MLLLAIVMQPSAHLSCDTLQSVDEKVFKSEGPMADVQPLP